MLTYFARDGQAYGMEITLRAAGETVRDADWLHLSDGEEVRWTGRPSRYTIAVALVAGVALAVAGLALAIWVRTWAGATGNPAWLAYLPLLLSVAGLCWTTVTYLDWLRLLYVVTSEEIYVKRGFVSRDVTQVRLDRVQNTAFEQSILQRLLGYGDVRVYTAGTNTEDVLLESVPNPERVAAELTELLSDRFDRPGDELRSQGM